MRSHIRDYVQTANRTILSEQQAVQDYRRMGTTLVSLFIDRDYRLAYWAHAGDSRLYLFRRGCCACHHRSQPRPADERCRASDRRSQQQPAVSGAGY
jgi:serine/threonine protein phosphatase PrpC